jgi:hypothetical protein
LEHLTERYRTLLWRVTDEAERRVLLELLADEEANQTEGDCQKRDKPPIHPRRQPRVPK